MSRVVNTIGDKLALFCFERVGPENIPKDILNADGLAPWWNLSLAMAYLSIAKHWIGKLTLSTPDLRDAVWQRIDTCLFDVADHTSFEVSIDRVLFESSERRRYFNWSALNRVDTSNETCNSASLVKLVFPTRAKEYSGDLQAGFDLERSGTSNCLGITVFVFKRFNEHVYGVKSDLRDIRLSESMRHIYPLGDMFVETCLDLVGFCTKMSRILRATP